MALQNIGADNRDDAFYRYKMPKLVTKIEGRGNGIKTNLVNMVDVAKALARPPSYTTKFFGCELGAQSKFDAKTGTSIVNGAHETAKLAGLLEIFIKKYVQCYGCGNPETEIIVSKNQLISLKCAACGFLSDVDMRDKLTTFILKNPPEQKKSGKEKKGLRKAETERLKEGETIDEEIKKAKKEGKKKKSQDETAKLSKKKPSGSDEEEHSPNVTQPEDEDNGASEDEVEWQTDTSAAAAQRRIQEQLTAATSEMVMLENGTRQPGVVKETVTKESEPETAGKKKSIQSTKAEDVLTNLKESSVYNELVKDIKDCLKNGLNSSQLVSHLQMKEGPRQEKMNAYFNCLFEGVSKGLSKEVAAKKKYLEKVVQDEDSQILLLRAIEAFCSSGTPSVCKEIARVLKVLYDEDILEEEEVLKWYDEGIAKRKESGEVWKNTKPFVDWLRSAEAESEED